MSRIEPADTKEYASRIEADALLEDWNQDKSRIALQVLRTQIDNLPDVVAGTNTFELKSSLEHYFTIAEAHHNKMFQLSQVMEQMPSSWVDSDCRRLYWDFMPLVGMDPNDWFLDDTSGDYQDTRNELYQRLNEAVNYLWERYTTDSYVNWVMENIFPEDAQANLNYGNCQDWELLWKAYQYTLISDWLLLRFTEGEIDTPAFDVYTRLELVGGEVVLIMTIEYLIDAEIQQLINRRARNEARNEAMRREYLIGFLKGYLDLTETANQIGFLALWKLNEMSQDARAYGSATNEAIGGIFEAFAGEKPFEEAGADFVAWLAGTLEGAARGIGADMMVDAATMANPFLYQFAPKPSELMGVGWDLLLDNTGISENEIYQDSVPGAEVGFAVSSLITPMAQPYISSGGRSLGNKLVKLGQEIKVAGINLEARFGQAADMLMGQPQLVFAFPGRGNVSAPALRLATAAEPSAATAITQAMSWVDELRLPIVMMSTANQMNNNDNSTSNSNPTRQDVENQIVDDIMAEHPGLNETTAREAARGGTHAKGSGGEGADIPLINGGGREVSVHSGAFDADSVYSHLKAEAIQTGTTEIYLQINSPSASRQGLLGMIPELRVWNYPLEEVSRDILIVFFGPDGQVWTRVNLYPRAPRI